jgi:ankyrin repeat protein
VVYICGCIPARIQQALAELPETLDETYQRTLREINKVDWEFVHRLFQFVAVASRPLRVEELAELLAFDFKAGPIPKFYEGWRLEDPVDAVMSSCSSLLAIVDGGYPFGKVIQFSHFSVKEYLTSARISEASDIIVRRYHVPMTPAHTLAARACLGILLHLDKDVVTRNNLDKFPLAEYAAKYWTDHALFEGVSQNVEDGLKQLFDPRNPHLAVCLWIYDPRGLNPTERLLTPLRISLHYAALWGFHFIVEFLVIERSQNVRSRGFSDNVTPLHLASARGHVKTARMLIELGAGVMAQNVYGETPLHLASDRGQVEVARMLIERGADVSAQKKIYGDTPLHAALRKGEVEVVRMLIERGADVAAQNDYGDAPLHLALRKGDVEVIRILIEHGADVAAQDRNGDTPLHLALEAESIEVEVVRMLIERGADVAAQTRDGDTPLHLASTLPSYYSYGEQVPPIIRILLERGADVNALNEAVLTLLRVASQSGYLRSSLVEFFLQHGADPGDVSSNNFDSGSGTEIDGVWN